MAWMQQSEMIFPWIGRAVWLYNAHTCNAPVSAIDKTDTYPPRAWGDDCQTYLYRCGGCPFWGASVHIPAEASRSDIACAGVLRKYPTISPSVPLDELVTYLNSHPSQLRLLDPRLFERLVAACLKAIWKPVDVIHVGGPSDGGIDVILAVVYKLLNARFWSRVASLIRHPLSSKYSTSWRRSVHPWQSGSLP